MARDGYVTLGALLTPEEAGMAQALLASAGVEAELEDQALSAIDPLVRLAIGGTKLLVRGEEADRARAILDGAGVLAPQGARPAEEVEIPEEEWSAPPPPEPDRPWPEVRYLVLFLVLVAAVVALLSEAGRHRWPPFGR